MKYMTAIFSEFSSGMGNIPDFFLILIEISWVQFCGMRITSKDQG